MRNFILLLVLLCAFSVNAQEVTSFNASKGRTFDFYSGLSLYDFRNLSDLLAENGFRRVSGAVLPFGVYFSSWNKKIATESDFAIETNFSSASSWTNFYFSFLVGYDVLNKDRWRVVPGLGGSFVGASVVAERSIGQTSMSNLLQNANAVRFNARPFLLDLAVSSYWISRPSEGGILHLKLGYRWDIGRPTEWTSNVVQISDPIRDNLSHFYFQLGIGFARSRN